MNKPTADTRRQVEYVDISSERADQRIDNFLIGRLKGVPKSRIQRLIRKGEVRVNKGRIKSDYRLMEGDQVRIPPVFMSISVKRAVPVDKYHQLIMDSILYEDDDLIVLNKPSGIAVHGGSGISFGIIELIRAIRPQLHYVELVHRLDRETSGCLLLAKKRSMLKVLHAQLRDHLIKKKYTTLMMGQWVGAQQKVVTKLKKNTTSSGERMVRIDEEGKESTTIFSLIRNYGAASLMQVRILTGRTHQIRVHATSLGKPVAGDQKYGDRAFNKQLRQQGLKRLFLHATSLQLKHPRSGDKLYVEAPLPNDLKTILQTI